MIKLTLHNFVRNQSKIACSTRIRPKYLSTLKATDKDNSTEDISFRNASECEIQRLSRKLIFKERWSIGSHDLMCAYKSFPNAFYVGVQKNEVVFYHTATMYPRFSGYIGLGFAEEKYRGCGYGRKSTEYLLSVLSDHVQTVGMDATIPFIPFLKDVGFTEIKWTTSIASLTVGRILRNLSHLQYLNRVQVKPFHTLDFERLNDYDASVFGASRYSFLRNWINIPGSLGWVALDDNKNIIGYAASRPVIVGGGTEMGLAMAPLIADDPQIAKLLLKTAADTYIDIYGSPNTKFDLVYPDGNNCGDGISEIFKEVEAECTKAGIGYRLYTRGIPYGRQCNKIYGILSPSFD